LFAALSEAKSGPHAPATGEASSVNIGRNQDDASFRYKMPRLQVKIEGRGNGIKTVVTNMTEIAKALRIDADCTCRGESRCDGDVRQTCCICLALARVVCCGDQTSSALVKQCC
jgi:hypothetical protein